MSSPAAGQHHQRPQGNPPVSAVRRSSPPRRTSRALAEYEKLWQRAKDDPEGFWAEQAESLYWFKHWDKVLDWNEPHAQWFVGGKINASYNCLDRHLQGPRKNKAAIIWEGEPGDSRVLRYQDLHREVCKFANVLKKLGIQAGRPRHDLHADGSRAGHRHAGLRPHRRDALASSSAASAPRPSPTATTTPRPGWSSPPTAAGGAARSCRSSRTSMPPWTNRRPSRSASSSIAAISKSTMKPGRDLWWHELMADASADCPAEPLDSEHPLFILYTSGSTGKPKGVLHTTAGYLLGTSLTHKWVFDLQEDDTYWCTADIGWVTGHSYIVYGPLANGATTVMYEGAPNHPREDRFWAIIEKYRVSIFYTAPTAIRAFIKWGDHWPAKHDLSSLRLLGTVGEPINPEAWMWYHEVIGKKRCPIVDTWWQTETGMIMIAPLPGAIADQARLGDAAVSRRRRRGRRSSRASRCRPNRAASWSSASPGRPCCAPSTATTSATASNTGARCRTSTSPPTAPARTRTATSGSWAGSTTCSTSSGHRLSTMEVESALVHHPQGRGGRRRRQAGRPQGRRDRLLRDARAAASPATEDLKKELREHVAKEIGALARPDEIRFTDSLPKTRSGKIMRRLLRDIASGQADRPAIRRRWRIIACWRSCGKRRNDRVFFTCGIAGG